MNEQNKYLLEEAAKDLASISDKMEQHMQAALNEKKEIQRECNARVQKERQLNQKMQ